MFSFMFFKRSESNIFGLDVYYSVRRRAVLEQTRSSLCLLMSEGHHSFSQTNQNQNGGFVHACCGFCLHENDLETYVFFVIDLHVGDCLIWYLNYSDSN